MTIDINRHLLSVSKVFRAAIVLAAIRSLLVGRTTFAQLNHNSTNFNEIPIQHNGLFSAANNIERSPNLNIADGSN